MGSVPGSSVDLFWCLLQPSQESFGPLGLSASIIPSLTFSSYSTDGFLDIVGLGPTSLVQSVCLIVVLAQREVFYRFSSAIRTAVFSRVLIPALVGFSVLPEHTPCSHLALCNHGFKLPII